MSTPPDRAAPPLLPDPTRAGELAPEPRTAGSPELAPDSLVAVVSSAPTPPVAEPRAGEDVYDPTSVAREVAPVAEATPASPPARASRPTFVFFGIVAAVSLLADVASKAWAEIELGRRTMLDPAIVLIENHLSLTLAYNKGGAWGLLQDASESVRRPFFLLVSALAIAFIVSLYGRLAPGQRALKWGLPLVLGGALGNLSDRIVRSSVIDWIDYRADWVQSGNEVVAKVFSGWGVTDHWPTFNVADISICVGVGLMAVDMLTSRRGGTERAAATDTHEVVPVAATVLEQSALDETPTVPLPEVAPRADDDGFEPGAGPR